MVAEFASTHRTGTVSVVTRLCMSAGLVSLCVKSIIKLSPAVKSEGKKKRERERKRERESVCV